MSGLTFLSDFEAPDGVHPVVYSPCIEHYETSHVRLRRVDTYGTACNSRVGQLMCQKMLRLHTHQGVELFLGRHLELA